MPWLTCTTGSPTFSSDRSLISASTLLVCSCLRLRRACGVVANSSVSVMNCRLSAGAASSGETRSSQWKPAARGDAAMATRSSPSMNACSESTLGTSMRWSRSISSRLSRRPSLSATSSTRAGVWRRWASSACSGSVAPRSTLTSGRGRAHSTGSLPRRDSVECGCVSVKKSSGRRNKASGGRRGRSGSCCRKRWRSRVSDQ